MLWTLHWYHGRPSSFVIYISTHSCKILATYQWLTYNSVSFAVVHDESFNEKSQYIDRIRSSWKESLKDTLQMQSVGSLSNIRGEPTAMAICYNEIENCIQSRQRYISTSCLFTTVWRITASSIIIGVDHIVVYDKDDIFLVVGWFKEVINITVTSSLIIDEVSYYVSVESLFFAVRIWESVKKKCIGILCKYKFKYVRNRGILYKFKYKIGERYTLNFARIQGNINVRINVSLYYFTF